MLQYNKIKSWIREFVERTSGHFTSQNAIRKIKNKFGIKFKKHHIIKISFSYYLKKC